MWEVGVGGGLDDARRRGEEVGVVGEAGLLAGPGLGVVGGLVLEISVLSGRRGHLGTRSPDHRFLLVLPCGGCDVQTSLVCPSVSLSLPFWAGRPTNSVDFFTL